MPSLTLLRRQLSQPLLSARGVDDSPPADTDGGTDHTINVLLGVLSVVFLALVVLAVLLMFRRARRHRQMRDAGMLLPSYYDAAPLVPGAYGPRGYNRPNNHHGLTIETKHHGRSSILVIGRDGNPMLANPNSPPHSPDNVPQIHITFPDEQDDQGRPKSGRVLVVRVGDNATVGLEPVHDDEQLPAYEKEAKGRFQSLDMDQLGGLKEKDRTLFR